MTHILKIGMSYTLCGPYFLPEPLKHSNVPPTRVPWGAQRMPMKDGWARAWDGGEVRYDDNSNRYVEIETRCAKCEAENEKRLHG